MRDAQQTATIAQQEALEVTAKADIRFDQMTKGSRRREVVIRRLMAKYIAARQSAAL